MRFAMCNKTRHQVQMNQSTRRGSSELCRTRNVQQNSIKSGIGAEKAKQWRDL
jgi:hypothetical protein